MNWIANLSIGEIAYVMLGFCVFILALKIAVAKLSNHDGYEEDED